MHTIDPNAFRLDTFERRITALEEKLAKLQPAKPKTAEEWCAANRAISTMSEHPEETSVVAFTDRIPEKIRHAVFGTPKIPIAMNVRVYKNMFLLALDKVLRDHGEIE